MIRAEVLASAHAILDEAILYYNGEPVGVAAALDTSGVLANYEECFVRDFVPSALVFLMDGKKILVSRNLKDYEDMLEGYGFYGLNRI